MPRIDDDDSDSDTVRDGETVSVRVNLTDTVRFDEDGRERFVRMADARRKAKPPDDDDDDDNDTTDAADIDVRDYQPGYRQCDDAARAKARAARQGMIDRATSAWRRQPQRASDMRSRDAAWARYRDGLANAWRGGRTDPRRAAQVEGLQERWRHGRDGATE